MTEERDIRTEDVEALLREWRESSRSLFAIVFDNEGMRACAGQITIVDGGTAVITDSETDLCIAYASAGDRAVTELDQSTKSVTLTWSDGGSAFIITRNTATT